MRLSTFLALAALGLTASALPAVAGTLLVPQQFPTIQKALNAAKPYDTVLVSAKSGGAVYNEAVTITTPHVVLQGKGGPVIDGSKQGVTVTDDFGNTTTTFPNGIEIQADHVAVRGMTVQGFAFRNFASGAASGINVGVSTPGANFTDVEASFSDIEISGDTLQKNYTGLSIAGYDGLDPNIYTGQGVYLKGYRVLNNLISGNSHGGGAVSGASVLVAGNRITGNLSFGGPADGLDVTGIGVAVLGNESGNNRGFGLSIADAAPIYDPSVNDAKSPNPAPTVTAGNSVHGNRSYGIEAQGTQAITGNLVADNGGHGINLDGTDYSAVLGNQVSGTVMEGFVPGDGTGIYVNNSNASYYGGDSGLKISGNQVSGNAGDGIFFNIVAGGLVSLNSVTGNQGVGIHLSDFSYFAGPGTVPITVTQNLALHNTLFDARDDTSAPDGDNAATINVWTKNLFGTTSPVGLSK